MHASDAIADIAFIYRDQIVRSVLGQRPAILAKNADMVLLSSLAQRLPDAEFALELLRAKGCGQRGQTLSEVVQDIPRAILC